MEEKQVKRLLKVFFILAVFSLGIVYAALNRQLDISGTTNIDSLWQVKISNIKEVDKSPSASTIKAEYNNTSMEFDVNLTSPGDFVEYQIEIENSGTLDAILESITRSVNDNEAIIFTTSGLKKGDIIPTTQTKVINVNISYAESITTQPKNVSETLELGLNFKQKK